MQDSLFKSVLQIKRLLSHLGIQNYNMYVVYTQFWLTICNYTTLEKVTLLYMIFRKWRILCPNLMSRGAMIQLAKES